MILFEKAIKTFLATMSCLFYGCLIIDRTKHFIRNHKISYKDCVKFIIWNNGRKNDIELAEFFKKFKNKKFETISRQAIEKQRMHIIPELFINLYKKFCDKIYGEHKHVSKINGYIVTARDDNIFDLPNLTLLA